jgi:uncharacterized protein YecE (DUF72 family)
MALFVGTSGWDYREWRGGFYPPALPQRRFLEHYASVLSACEVNTTFYRVHSEATFERWRGATPECFRFAVKAHRRLTHRRMVLDEAWRDFLEGFMGSLAPIRERLGCILFQFPPNLERDDEGIDALLAALADIPFAIEFRHESWQDDDIAQRIAAHGGTVCLSDTTGTVAAGLPPGPRAYVRLRADRYSSAEREGWRELLEREAAVRDVYAFAKHKGVPAGDPHTGVGLAEWLASASALS